MAWHAPTRWQTVRLYGRDTRWAASNVELQASIFIRKSFSSMLMRLLWVVAVFTASRRRSLTLVSSDQPSGLLRPGPGDQLDNSTRTATLRHFMPKFHKPGDPCKDRAPVSLPTAIKKTPVSSKWYFLLNFPERGRLMSVPLTAVPGGTAVLAGKYSPT